MARCSRRLQQFTKLLDGQAGIASDTAHGECIDRIVPRDSHDALAIAHDDMLPLTRDAKAGFLECAHSVKVIDARNTRQG